MALRKYPWEEWFSKPLTVLQRGTDYTLSQAMMYQTVRNNIWRANGKRVRVRDADDSIIIEVSEVGNNEVSCSDQATVVDERTDALARAAKDEAITEAGDVLRHSADWRKKEDSAPATDSNNNTHRTKKTGRRQPTGCL